MPEGASTEGKNSLKKSLRERERERVGDRPNTVSESTVSNAELSECLPSQIFRGENSVAELTKFAPKLSEFALLKQYS